MSSVLNSTTSPLAGSATYTGSSELVKYYNAISCMIKCDQNATLYVDHGDSSGNWDTTDSFSVTSGTSLWKQVNVKGSNFRIRCLNGSASPMTYLRLYTKLLAHALPDEFNVKLDASDKVVAILKDGSDNAVTVTSNKLNVNQNALSNATDNVLGYAWDGSANQKVSSNASGHLNTVKNNLINSSDNVLAYAWDGSANQKVSSDASGHLNTVKNNLINSSDNVLAYAWDGSANQKVSSNASGHLNTVKNNLINSSDNVLAYGWDGSANVKLKTDANGKLDVTTSYSSQSSYVNSTLEETPIAIKASAGYVCGLQLFNDSAGHRNIRLHNKASAPVAADVPLLYFELEANTSLVIPSLNVYFADKIYIVGSATKGTTGALENVNANELSCSVQYV